MGIQVDGLDEFRRELRRVDKRLPKALQKANKQISERVVNRGRPAVQSLSSPGGTKAMGGIRPRAGQREAKIVLLGSNPTVRANVLGTLSHTVFGRTVSGSGPWKPWLGKSWSPEQLYGLGPVIRTEADTFALDDYADALEEALAKAFPD